MRDEGGRLVLPECVAQYLLDHLFEMGPTVPGGTSFAPLPHSEIESWQRNSGVRLDPWECATIRRLSEQYIEQYHLSRDRSCLSPLSESVTEDLRARVANQFQAFIGSSRVKREEQA
jgi:hypothetical protein